MRSKNSPFTIFIIAPVQGVSRGWCLELDTNNITLHTLLTRTQSILATFGGRDITATIKKGKKLCISRIAACNG